MIRIEGLTKIYSGQLALEHVDIQIDPNQITGLIGPNGAGKSTLMKLICGLIDPNEGSVFIDDQPMELTNMELRKKIGYLPESNPLYPEMYVKEYLSYVAGIYKLNDKRKKIEEIIEKTGLGKEQHKKINFLSKGYKQRVGIAQAMIHDPQILILDEPTSGLDPNQLVEVRNLISELGKNKTVLLSTHILQEVEAICNNVLLIDNGKVLAHKDTKNMRQQKNKNLVVEFDQTTTAQQLEEIEGVFKATNVKENVWILSSKVDADIRAAVFQFAVKQGLVVLSSHIEELRLEEIFHQMTKIKE